MMRARVFATLIAMQACGAFAADADIACRQTKPLQIRVRIADQDAQPALLVGSETSGLRLISVSNGAELWSAGSGTGHSQRFGQMTAAFGSSLTAIDLDADGIHDRIYAGDRIGQLWRFDLEAAAPASRWASGGVFASLGAADVARGFIAAPDVALIPGGSNASWLSIAIGTATVGTGAPSNRFYVLRDHRAFERWDAQSHRSLHPLVESELQPVQAPLQAADLTGPGYFIPLGTSQVLARSLTLAGLIYFTVAETSRRLASGCPDHTLPSQPSMVSISVIRAADGAITQDLNEDGRADRGDHRVSLPRSLPADADVELPASNVTASNRISCSIAGISVHACGLDTSPHRTYWRREDAD